MWLLDEAKQNALELLYDRANYDKSDLKYESELIDPNA